MKALIRLLRGEKRQQQGQATGFTSSIVAALENLAGAGAPRSHQIGSVEAVAGLVGRCFAVARVDAPPGIKRALDPALLADIGHAMARDGDTCLFIDVYDGRLHLQRVGFWYVRSSGDDGYREMDWTYQLTLFGASSTVTKYVPSSAVIHPRMTVDPARPWIGVSALGWAAATGLLAGYAEHRLGEEMGAAVGRVLPSPQKPTGTDNDPTTALRNDLAQAAGRTLVVPSWRSGLGDAANAPSKEWTPIRVGPEPPTSNVTLRADSEKTVMDAMGGPRALFDVAGAAGSREAWRRFLSSTLQPIAQVVAHELSVKLDADVKIDFPSLVSTDLAARGRVVKQLVDSGVPLAEAMRIAGFE